jgi:uncharacterized membrane protein
MHAILDPLAIVQILAIGFALAGITQWLGPGFVRRAYRRWNFPSGQYRVTGTLELAAAVLLAIPNTRLWGIALAGLITFGAVVTLLKNRQYAWAIPGVAVLIALAPAMLAATV